jgi:hypothetical protein
MGLTWFPSAKELAGRVGSQCERMTASHLENYLGKWVGFHLSPEISGESMTSNAAVSQATGTPGLERNSDPGDKGRDTFFLPWDLSAAELAPLSCLQPWPGAPASLGWLKTWVPEPGPSLGLKSNLPFTKCEASGSVYSSPPRAGVLPLQNWIISSI